MFFHKRKLLERKKGEGKDRLREKRIFKSKVLTKQLQHDFKCKSSLTILFLILVENLHAVRAAP